jgi:hypothetical protein
MMWRTGRFARSFALMCLLAGVGCSASPPDDGGPIAGAGGQTGGSGGAGGRGGQGAAGGGGAGGAATGGTGGGGGAGGAGAGSGGSGAGGAGGTGAGAGGAGGNGGDGGAPGADASSGQTDAGADTAATDAPPAGGGGGPDPASINYGGVGQRPDVPLLYTATPVPPLVAPECPEDPTQGFTEYKTTFQVQRPHDRAAAERMKYENGIYTFWVTSSDQAHQPGNTTAPRTEARYPNFSSGEHIWSADVMFETVSRTCIMQIHNVNPAIAMYMRVQGNRMFNLSTGTTILTSYNNKWFNLKVALNTRTLQVRIFVNNCLKETSRAPSSGTPDWYFKHGTYTCDSGTCRANFKNIHLYRRD